MVTTGAVDGEQDSNHLLVEHYRRKEGRRERIPLSKGEDQVSLDQITRMIS